MPSKESQTIFSSDQFRDFIAPYIGQALDPPPDLSVSQWADQCRVLSPESSAEPGPWRTSRTPYLQEILDTVKDSTIEIIVFMSGSQVGKTEVSLNSIGYYIDYEPSPILMLQPTLEMAQTFSKDRLAPMLRDSPALAGKVKDSKARDSGNRILHKSFPGGHITMAGANSPASLASRPIRILLCDEVDRYPPSAGTEGDPVNLAKKRTTTFYNKKILLVSTPTVKGASRIESAFEESDQRRYFVPCPHCEELQYLKWRQVQWPKEDPKQTVYVCEHCEEPIKNRHKNSMLKEGQWISTADSPTGKVAGFHLNELYSPWKKWHEVVEDFLEAKKAPDTLKTWVNTSLGETWEDQGETIEIERWDERTEDYPANEAPEKALVITAGVDVQNDRLEAEIVAWGPGEESWSLEYHIIHGSPAYEETWDKLDAYLDKVYPHPGGALHIACACIDSGGHHSNAVYEYVKPREFKKIFAVKGQSQAGKPLVGRPTKSNKGKVKLFPIGTDTAKEVIYARLRIENPGQGYCHFPKRYDEEYFAQLTAEKIVTKFKKGHATREWVKTRPRNEALDNRVYALAALKILNPNWDALKQRFRPRDDEQETTQTQKRRKKFNDFKGRRPRRNSWI